MRVLIWFLCGGLFGIGLGVSGMTQPAKVVGFLNVLGDWDPSLALVMLGAIGVHLPGYLIRARMVKPLAADAFEVPTRQDVTVRLLLGATLFGLGWGIAGYCPGPALVGVMSGNVAPIVFVLSMIVGVLCHQYVVPVENSAA